MSDAPEAIAYRIPVARPMLPTADALLPYLRRIDAGRRYSNRGPLERTLRQRIAARFGLSEANVATVANGTLGIAAALIAAGAPRGTACLLPAWTFSATAHAVRLAGLVPRFLDVDEATQMLSPDAVTRAAAASSDVGAVVVVSPFGRSVDPVPWEEVARAVSAPVVIDAAAGYDGLRIGALCSVVSLHATKTLAAGEGGFVISTDTPAIASVAAAAEFGMRGDRSAAGPGLNAKLSEYHAAVGLAALDGWTETRARYLDRLVRYRRWLAGAVDLPPGLGERWVASTLVALSDDAAAIAAALSDAGIETRRWWGAGCHRTPAFAADGLDLPATDRLAARSIGLPLHPDMPAAAIDEVAAIVLRTVDGTRAHR